MTSKEIVNGKRVLVSTHNVCDMSDLAVMGWIDNELVINSSRKGLGFNEYTACTLLKRVAKGEIKPDPNWIDKS